MKALALDTAISCIQIAAKNDDYLASLTLDIGMRQSEKLLPAIDYVLKQADLTPGDLDYTVLTQGPGSFTGLRLGFAALKAIELFGGKKAADENSSQAQKAGANENSFQDQKAGGRSKIPLYGINSLDAYAWPFMDFDGIVLPIIDAHKDKFYAKAFLNGSEILPCDDWDLRALEEKVLAASESLSQDQKLAAKDTILVCGLEAKAFVDACKENDLFKGKKIIAQRGRAISLESLFALAEEKISKGLSPLADYDGPQYYRASEAERNVADAPSAQ